MLQNGKIAISAVHVGDRQRKEYNNIESMAESLKTRGQLTPILVKPNGELVAGGRRLRAATMLGWTEIWAAVKEVLSDHEAQALELEENIKREDLLWWERVLAVERYHRMREALDAEWTAAKSADELGISSAEISRAMLVARSLAEEPAVKEMQGVTAAYNYLQRKLGRSIAAETGKLLDAVADDDEEDDAGGPSELRLPSASSPNSAGDPAPRAEPVVEFKKSPSRFRVAAGNFHELLATTSGKIKYNFLHCDFPYGVGMDTSALQGTSERHERYEDTPEIYWKLVDDFLANQEKIIQPSCHIMFWFSMKFYTETIQRFSLGGWNVNPHPLVWLKSDGKGIIPDPTRGPRQIVETALLMSRGDRKIVRPVANGFAFPSSKADAEHLSEKPAEMLSHFFRMFVDESTEMLDPTCGGGSSLVAAIRAGASRAFGLDLNPAFADIARRRVEEELLAPDPINLRDLDLGAGLASAMAVAQ